MWTYLALIDDCLEVFESMIPDNYYCVYNGKMFPISQTQIFRTKEECLLNYYKEQSFKINDSKRKHIEQIAKKDKELEDLYNKFKDVIEENPHILITLK